MPTRHAALVRGINVGKAKRVAMTDLRAAVERLGFTDVRTLLNSGNVVFTAPGKSAGGAAAKIEAALATKIGVPARVTVLSAAEIAAAVDGCPLLGVADNPSRLLVTVLTDPADRKLLEPLTRQKWSPEALALGERVAYLWCPNSILDSPLNAAVGKVLRDGATARNWATLLKLRALLDGSA